MAGHLFSLQSMANSPSRLCLLAYLQGSGRDLEVPHIPSASNWPMASLLIDQESIEEQDLNIRINPTEVLWVDD